MRTLRFGMQEALEEMIKGTDTKKQSTINLRTTMVAGPFGGISSLENIIREQEEQGWEMDRRMDIRDMDKMREALGNITREELYWPLHLLEAWGEYIY